MHARPVFLRQQPGRIAVRMVRRAFIQNRPHAVRQRTHVLIGRDLGRVQHTHALLWFVRVPYLFFVVHGEEERMPCEGISGSTRGSSAQSICARKCIGAASP